MDYREYYGEPFRSDLSAVISAVPSGHSTEREYVIQPRTLSTENPIIRKWEQNRINLFATALFYTVLIDQVCHHHFHHLYDEFEKLTRYPKLLGDCPGGCIWGYAHPVMILQSIGSPPGPASNWVASAGLIENSRSVMREEIGSFAENHLPSMDAEIFWEKVVAELPAECT